MVAVQTCAGEQGKAFGEIERVVDGRWEFDVSKVSGTRKE